MWVFHVPMLKSKSCCPSRNSLDDDSTGAAATACASALIESKHTTSKPERNIPLTFRAGFSAFFITMSFSPPESESAIPRSLPANNYLTTLTKIGERVVF